MLYKKNICQVPQSLLEKNIRIGRIKVNKKKKKSSYKLQLNDKIIINNSGDKGVSASRFRFVSLKAIFRSLILVLCFAVTGCAGEPETVVGGDLAFGGVNVVPMTGEGEPVIADQLLIVTDGRITCIGDSDDVVSPTSLLDAKDFLIRNNIEIKTKMINNCGHHIPVEASSLALEYIKKNLIN